ncbi:MFS transporter [Haloprofundus salilacus]|uniref:MFS transporter n=1 Tax=Haloprofundus salilacus TaxID=2876190 RepID=UPI001CCA03C1|nr:MFS transporter [Haloprofundus salilacus]
MNLDAVTDRFPSQLVRYLAAVTLCFVAFSVFFGPLPAYLTDAGYATGEIFALFVLSSVGSAVLYVRAGEMAAEHDIHLLQSGALTTRAACFPLVALVGLAVPGTTRLVVAGVLFALVGFTWAVISVTATGLVSRLASESVRGDAFGVYAALAGVGGGVGSALGGALADGIGYVYTFGAAGVLVLIGVAAVLASRRRLTPRL